MSKSKKVSAAKSADKTPVVNIETPLEVIPGEISTVKLIAVQPDRKAGQKLEPVTSKKDKAEVVSIPEDVLAELAEMNLNTVNSIKTLYAAGFTRQQIIKAGYNSSTVHRQVLEYTKSLATVKAEKAEVKEHAETLAEASSISMPEEVNEDLAEDGEIDM